MSIARRVVLVADSTKFGRDSYVRVAPSARSTLSPTSVSLEWVRRIEASEAQLHLAAITGA